MRVSSTTAIETAIGRFGYEVLYAQNDVVLLRKGIAPQPQHRRSPGQVQELLQSGGKYAPAAQETIAFLGRTVGARGAAGDGRE